jgi:AcrR family transcriptional regulator
VAARGDDTKAALIAATTRLVAEVGYQRTTTKAIAKLAGVAEGTIYRHFPDKRALFLAAVLEGRQGMLDWMAGLPGRAGTAPLPDVLTECFERLSELRAEVVPLEMAMAATPEFNRVELSPEELIEAVREIGGPPRSLADYLAAEQRLGRVRPDLDPTRTAVMLLACLFGVQTSPLAQVEGATGPAVRELVRIVLTGIAADR